MIKLTLCMVIVSIALYIVMRIWIATLSPLDKLAFIKHGALPGKKSTIFIILSVLIWMITFILSIISALYLVLK